MTYLWLIPFFPLLGAMILGILSAATARNTNGPSVGMVGMFGVLMPALAFACTVAAASGILGPDTIKLQETLWSWFPIGNFSLSLGFLFDRLSGLMLLFVTGIGTLICLYSVGYMQADRGFARFMCYLNLFLFSMILLVLGDSLLVTFLGWEGVGLCSYLLIGFWHRNDAYNDAARKAFVVNRIGDLGFLLGVFVLAAAVGTISYEGLAKEFTNAAATKDATLIAVASIAGLLLFIGCTGKSAQVPLVTWLPDAMAGPTPVSALIHAATMVTAGVFLVGRLGPVYAAAAPWLLDVVLLVGCITAVWGAVAGLFQHDIKKALAYSTVSQLGFMFMACGIGRFDIALFHVFTHAFFKATLFLGAGAVIHSLHHEQDMRRMGGLRLLMPFTHAMMLWAWFAIIGGPGSSGFWSKDMILESLIGGHGWGPVIGVIAMITAFITAIYMTRMFVLTFYGKNRTDPSVTAHLHAVPWTMTLPLLILGTGSLVVGFLWFSFAFMGAGSWAGNTFQVWLDPALRASQDIIASRHPVHEHHPYWVTYVATLLAMIGAGFAFWKYRAGPAVVPSTSVSSDPTGFGAAWTWAFDWLYNHSIVPLTIAMGWILMVIDHIINWFTDDAVKIAAYFFGEQGVKVQRSRLRSNLILSVAGVVAVLALFIFGGGR